MSEPSPELDGRFQAKMQGLIGRMAMASEMLGQEFTGLGVEALIDEVNKLRGELENRNREPYRWWLTRLAALFEAARELRLAHQAFSGACVELERLHAQEGEALARQCACPHCRTGASRG